MFALGTEERHNRTRRRLIYRDGTEYFRSEWLETDKDPVLSPTVFLIEMPPGMVLEPHFHRQDQFQVVTAGNGTVGPQALVPGSVNYVSGYTGYGPLIAGAEGMSYLTIRCVNEVGALYIPENMDQMRKRPKCKMVKSLPPDCYLGSGIRSSAQPMFADEHSSAASSVLYIAPNATMEGPRHSGHGQYYLVLDGALMHSDQELSRWEHLFVGPDSGNYKICAGSLGLKVLFLQFPEKK